MSWVRRRILFPLILAMALALATLVLFEIVIRAAAPFSPFVRLLTRSEAVREPARSLPEFLDQHGVGFHPGRAMGGRFRNSFGLQSPEPREGASRRIVVVGDSFVVNDYPSGWMWPALLEHTLAIESGDESTRPAPERAREAEVVEVLTFALPGIGPLDYEALWDLAGREVQPDVLLVSFFVGNDFQNFRELRSEKPPRLRAALFLRNLWRFLDNRATRDDGERGQRSDLPRRRVGRAGTEIPGYERRFVNHRPTLAEDYYRAIKSEVLNIFSVANQDLLQTEVLRVAEILARICRDAEESGAECRVVIFPDELQVETELRASLLAELDRETERFDFELPNAALAERLTGLGVEAIDLLSCLRGSGTVLFRPRDTHLNRRGNELAAQCIAMRLEDSAALSSPSEHGNQARSGSDATSDQVRAPRMETR